MAIELKQSLKLSQQLLITPQLQQAIKLLQLSRLELVETVQKELMENPILEEAPDQDNPEFNNVEQRPTDLTTATGSNEVAPSESKEFDWANYIDSFRNFSKEPRSFSQNDEIPNYENMLTTATSLHDHLDWQVKLGSLTPEEEENCEFIIGNLDDNGYLPLSLEELTEKSGHSVDELDDALCLVQDMDPPGVGARNLQECLLLQVKDYGNDRSLLTEIINKYLGLIEKRDFATLSKKMGLTPKRTKDLADIIFTLEPKPGRAFGRGEAQYITPDVYVQKVGEEYVVILNEDGLPKLQISNFYKSAIMKEMAGRQNGGGKGATAVPNAKNDEAQGYIQEKLKSALWLIKSIHQRQKTLYKVTKSIAHFQKEFMDKGVQSLKPLVLRNVADEIGVHESTVSRATNGKYVHTPQGIFELKYFFNTGLSHVTGGDDFANESVKQMVKQFIAAENVKAPLSDQILAAMLKQHNINIARRTVAKYRDMLGILPSSRRKRAF